MPSYFPEVNTPEAGDSSQRSLAKINALLAGSTTGNLEKRVDTISDLKSETNKVGIRQVLGYDAAFDGVDIPPYYADLSDTSSADNGGSIIVADDGTRWKWVTVPTIIDFRMFGCRVDGTTNDLDSAQAAIDYGNPVILHDGEMAINGTLNNPNLVPIICKGTIKQIGTGDCFVWGQDDSSNHNYVRSIRSSLRIIRSSTDWTDVASGLKLLNVNNIQLDVEVRSFHTGIELVGKDASCSYSNIHINRILDCKESIRFHAAGTTGFTNENKFFGGRFATGSVINSSDPIHGIVCHNDSANIINGNQFFGPSFELHNAGSGETSIIHGRTSTGQTTVAFSNGLHAFRMETTEKLISGIGVVENYFEFGVSPTTVSATKDIISGDDATETTRHVRNRIFGYGRSLQYSDQPVRLATIQRNGVVEYTVSTFERISATGRSVWYRASGRHEFANRDAAAAIATDWFGSTATNAVFGFLFDLRNVDFDYQRKLEIKAVLEATGGRIAAVVWNSAFTRLTGADDCTLTHGASVELFQTQSDATQPKSEESIAFGPNVAYAMVGIAGGTADAKIREMSVYALAQSDIRLVTDQSVYNSLSAGAVAVPKFAHDLPIATEKPDIPGAGNSYPTGTIVYNEDTSSGIVGWRWNGTAWNEFRETPQQSALTTQDGATVDATYGSEEQGVIQNNRTRIAEIETALQNLNILP